VGFIKKWPKLSTNDPKKLLYSNTGKNGKNYL
jgi:hypothetical protein